MEPEKPICLSLHLCESAYRDQATGKSYLLGIMETIFAQQIPCVVPVIVIHFELTSAAGEYELEVAVENEQTEEPFSTIVPRRKVFLQSPLQVYAINAAVRGLTFNAPGRYWFKVRTNGAVIAQRSLGIRLRTARASAIPPAASTDGEDPLAPEVPPDAL